MLLPLIFLLLLCTGVSAHTPHDNVHAIATADLPSGVRQTLMSTRSHGRILRTEDGGLSWKAVHGASLELARADRIVWDQQGQRFLIGTNRGVWAYDPALNLTTELNDGLGNGVYRYVTDMVIPSNGVDSPIFIITVGGVVMRLSRESQSWELSLNTGNSDDRGQLAINSRFNYGDPVGATQQIAAAVMGVLYLSEDGGDSWAIHSQFSNPAVLPNDPLITALSFADDYEKSGNFVVATSTENLANFTGDQGEIWHSSDFAETFTLALQSDSSFRRIQATPRGPSGKQWFLASVFEHPSFADLPNSNGIFRSFDGGLTWDDYGSAQDFIAEKDGSWSVSANRAEIVDFEVSPTFALDGQILFGRTEGLFESKDEGLYWTRKPYRHVMHTRSLSSYIDASGETWVACGTYGSGMTLQRLSDGTVSLLDQGPIPYLDSLVVSPNFAGDGTIFVAGLGGESFWFDPVLAAPNPFGKWGWVRINGSNSLGYGRFTGFSPNYDGRGLPGFDQTLFFSTSSWAETNFRSTDGGVTVEALDKMSNGSAAPFFENLVVAPTYDAETAEGRSDVYASRGRELFRLEDLRWKHVATMPATIKAVALASDYDRDILTPGRPLVFVGMDKFPYFSVLEDNIGNPGISNYSTGLEEGVVVSLACPPDFGTERVIYLSTYSDGIKKLDLTSSAPAWENVGGVFPDYFVDTMTLSANFAVDRTLLIGTQAGLVVGEDDPGSDWQLRQGPFSRDNYSPIYRFYQPNNPANPQPDRLWSWSNENTVALREYSEMTFCGDTAAFTESDGSYVLITDEAKSIIINTFSGPTVGIAHVTITNALTGELVATRTTDLQSSTWKNKALSFSFHRQPVDVRVDLELAPGEKFHLDSVTFIP